MNIETFRTTCTHPGCHDLFGSDDPLEEYRGTYMESMTRSEALAEVQREEASETRPLMKLALLDLQEAIIRGTGAREAFRRVRVASLHSGDNAC